MLKFFSLNKQQLILVGSAAVLIALLVAFGNTIPPAKQNAVKPNAPHQHADASIGSSMLTIDTFVKGGKKSLTTTQLAYIQKLEADLAKATAPTAGLYSKLSAFWRDSAKMFEPYAYYNAEAAKLENSEKSLTFAARLLITDLTEEKDPLRQNFYAANAKVLFEKALQLNPDNDSSKIGLGLCYMFGRISDNPMEGILPIRAIAEKNPDNLYAQKVLALGGLQSGQVDKAIERFNIILAKQPGNIEILFRLADVYEQRHEEPKAIALYTRIKSLGVSADIKRDIDERIAQLKNHQH